MKKRSLLIVMLVMLALVTSGFTYAFWAASISDADTTATGTITIGEGNAVTTAVNVSNVSATAGTELVPVGYAVETPTDDPLTVDTYVFSFTVAWTGTGAEGATGVLSVSVDSIQINSADFSSLFTVTVLTGQGAITAGTNATVTVEVEFTNEPSDAAEYALVAMNNLIVTLSFDVVAD